MINMEKTNTKLQSNNEVKKRISEIVETFEKEMEGFPNSIKIIILKFALLRYEDEDQGNRMMEKITDSINMTLKNKNEGESAP